MDDGSGCVDIQYNNPKFIEILTTIRHVKVDLIINTHDPRVLYKRTRTKFTDFTLYCDIDEKFLKGIYEDISSIHCDPYQCQDFIDQYQDHTGSKLVFTDPEKKKYFHKFIHIKTKTNHSPYTNVYNQKFDVTNSFWKDKFYDQVDKENKDKI